MGSRIGKQIRAWSLAAILIGALGSSPAWSATGTLRITVVPGNSVSVRVTPTTLTLVQDVTNPGADWTFQKNPQPWFPAGVSNGWVYAPSGQIGCTTVEILTFKESYALAASITLDPPGAPLAVYLSDTGTSCATPTARATQISPSSSSPTTLAAGLTHSLTKYYSVLVVPRGGASVSGITTVTITWALQ